MIIQYELIGIFDCPWFAKAQMLAKHIQKFNPNVEFHEEMLDSNQWAEFVNRMNLRQGWELKRSPCVYEVLVDPDSRGHLIGDLRDFCEYAWAYFNLGIDPSSDTIRGLIEINKLLFARAGLISRTDDDMDVLRVAIVNAPIKSLEYILTQLLSQFIMVPVGLRFNIYIFDEFTPVKTLDGLLMEIMDLSSPFLHKVQVVPNLTMAFYKCHLCLLMEDFSRSLVEEQRDWLDRVEYKVMRMMNALNSKVTYITDLRIYVGGDGPSCYVAEICRRMTPLTICGEGKIISTGQHIVQLAKSELGRLARIPTGSISMLHAYGWPGITGCYVEVRDATLRGKVRGPSAETRMSGNVAKADYIYSRFSTDFLALQQRRLEYLQKIPNRFMSLAESCITTIHDWLITDPPVRLMAGGDCFMPFAGELSADEFKGTGDIYLPVLNVGLECTESSGFPPGTFMTQPAFCFKGRWVPLGKVSEKTAETITEEVKKLWAIRNTATFRDANISEIFPDYEELTKEGDDPNDNQRKSQAYRSELSDYPEEGYGQDDDADIDDNDETSNYTDEYSVGEEEL